MLKNKFPKQKFSVRSDTYSGGAIINVDWTDGVNEEAVDEAISYLERSGFDGSIDLKYYIDHWMLPDGSITQARSQGTENSGGYRKGFNNPKPHPEAVKINLGADFIFTNRHVSDSIRNDAVETILKSYNNPDWGTKNNVQTAVYHILKKADLNNYKGLEHTDVTCGSLEKLYKVKA